jgi:starch synthase
MTAPGRGPAHSRRGAPLRILFAAAEAVPFIKTGGLADVAGALPAALHRAGCDVRLVLPAYRSVLRNTDAVAATPDTGGPFRILRTQLPDSGVPVYLVDAPPLFDRPGTPYQDEDGRDWQDNALRFACLCDAVEALGSDAAGMSWQPDIVHCHDWHTGLAPARLAARAGRPATVFTVHSLAHQGNFPGNVFGELDLPEDLWSSEALEFHGMLSFIKGGLAFADRLTTVSPTYAGEILTPEFGCGLDGLLRHRADRLRGILNGADYSVWDPRRDPHIAAPYWSNRLAGKQTCKQQLQEECGLRIGPHYVVIAHVSRFTQQKGIDLTLAALPRILADETVQVVLLGSGDRDLEQQALAAAARLPGRVAARVAHSEALAHRIQAGADLLLSPSRFEPCGLTHLYAMRYGSLPIVRATGGLVDTVVDATAESLQDGTATGFRFREPEPAALAETVERALLLRRSDPGSWKRLVRAAMKCEFSWDASATAYIELFRELAARG